MIRVLAEEYRFPLEQMARGVPIQIEVDGRRRRKSADLVVYRDAETRELDAVERIVVVRDSKTKPNDRSNGVGLLEQLLDAVDGCEFGLWTNGRDVAYLQKKPGPLQSVVRGAFGLPGRGRVARRSRSAGPADRARRCREDLRETVLRCHDYLYGNQAMTAPRAFGELIKLIFCKIYDERLLRGQPRAGRQFWVGVTERNTPAGQEAIAIASRRSSIA